MSILAVIAILGQIQNPVSPSFHPSSNLLLLFSLSALPLFPHCIVSHYLFPSFLIPNRAYSEAVRPRSFKSRSSISCLPYLAIIIEIIAKLAQVLSKSPSPPPLSRSPAHQMLILVKRNPRRVDKCRVSSEGDVSLLARSGRSLGRECTVVSRVWFPVGELKGRS